MTHTFTSDSISSSVMSKNTYDLVLEVGNKAHFTPVVLLTPREPLTPAAPMTSPGKSHKT